MDFEYFANQDRESQKVFFDRLTEVHKEVGLYTKEGFITRLEATRRGELPSITGATSLDHYIDMYRQQLSDWQHSRTVVESQTFEQRLSTKWAQRPRDIRPHEQAVLEFPMPSDGFDQP